MTMDISYHACQTIFCLGALNPDIPELYIYNLLIFWPARRFLNVQSTRHDKVTHKHVQNNQAVTLSPLTMASTKEHAATVLLSRAHSPTTTTDIFRDKIQNRPLLLRPSSPDPKENARTARQVSRQKAALALRRSKKPKPLSAKQKRALGVYDIPKEQRKYSIYEPLCRMWCGYIREVLGVSVDDQGQQSDRYLTPAGAGPMLASADFHGALLEVVRSRCVSRVGIKGIVVKDRKFSFEIITRKNELKSEFDLLFDWIRMR